MKFIRANEVGAERLVAFLQYNRQIDRKALLENGYVIEIKNHISGCFILHPMNEQSFWLKQLYVIQDYARALPIVIEAILVLAKELNATYLYANSHQPVVDLLLESLQFCPQQRALFPEYHLNTKGTWWLYCLSS